MSACRLDVSRLARTLVCFDGHCLIDRRWSWAGNSGVLLFPIHDSPSVVSDHHNWPKHDTDLVRTLDSGWTLLRGTRGLILGDYFVFIWTGAVTTPERL